MSQLKKLSNIKEMIHRENKNILLEVDGGVNAKNFSSLVSAGADILVAGSSVFNAGKKCILRILKN